VKCATKSGKVQCEISLKCVNFRVLTLCETSVGQSDGLNFGERSTP